MNIELQARLRVEDAIESVRYQVRAETPLQEVVDLMVREGVRAVPVVGEGSEVLGIITSGDALAQVLKEGPPERSTRTGVPPDLTARTIMTRTVLCVSEDQRLSDAARLMVNRNVEQLPVVRDGELVGIITRDGTLRALHGGGAGQHAKGADA
jgi:CBS domain-containing protein